MATILGPLVFVSMGGGLVADADADADEAEAETVAVDEELGN